MANDITTTPKKTEKVPAIALDTRFVNAMRLDARLWIAVAAVVA